MYLNIGGTCMKKKVRRSYNTVGFAPGSGLGFGAFAFGAIVGAGVSTASIFSLGMASAVALKKSVVESYNEIIKKTEEAVNEEKNKKES